jgi:hypothetical protein
MTAATIVINPEKPRARAVSSVSSTSAMALSDADPERARAAGAVLGAVEGGAPLELAGAASDPALRGAPDLRRRATDVSRTSYPLSCLRFTRARDPRRRGPPEANKPCDRV